MNLVCINLMRSDCTRKLPTTRLLLCKEVNELSTFETTNQVGTQSGPKKHVPKNAASKTWKHIPHWCFIQNNERILTIRRKKLPHQAEKNTTFCSFTSRVAGKKHGWHLGAQEGCDATVFFLRWGMFLQPLLWSYLQLHHVIQHDQRFKLGMVNTYKSMIIYNYHLNINGAIGASTSLTPLGLKQLHRPSGPRATRQQSQQSCSGGRGASRKYGG